MVKYDFLFLFLCYFSYRSGHCFSDYIDSFATIVFCLCKDTSDVQINFGFQNSSLIIFRVTLSQFHFPRSEISILFMYSCTKITKVLCFSPVPVVRRIFKKGQLSATFSQLFVGVYLEPCSKILNLIILFNCFLLPI